MNDNGHSPFTGHVDDLRKLAATKEQEAAKLRRDLEVVQDLAHRCLRAIEVLTGEKPERKTERKPRPRRGSVPREANLDKVMRAIADGAETMAEIAKAAGLSESTVSYALRHLRETHMVRVTGKRTGGRHVPPQTFALMPGVLSPSAGSLTLRGPGVHDAS